MNDLVERDAVKRSLTNEYNRKRTGDGLRLAWIEKAVNDVPSAQPKIIACGEGILTQLGQELEPKQQWIPVAERLPELCQRAICQNRHGEMMIGTYTAFGWMFPCYFEKPIAWMPLPEPWEGGEDGNS